MKHIRLFGLIFLLWTFVGCKLLPDKSEFSGDSDIRIGDTYTLQTDIAANMQLSAVKSVNPAFVGEFGQAYRIAELKDGFARVEQSGWIPVWYFTQDAERVRTITPEVRIVSRPVCVQIAPVPLSEAEAESCKDDPAVQKLGPGTVVRLLKSFDDAWYAVEFMRGEAAYGADQWVPASALEPYSPEKARDGRIRPGATVYDVTTKQPRNDVWNGHASIAEELPGAIVDLPGKVYLVYGPGGESGYIRKEDFLPNPFEE
ncbi:MAG: hypothetical protein BLM47_08870 [Candidatus Reconcilbacillus cellulovorans]|uniref:Uncharacterized protein n=1 Tax=Candidatus Reconcilbacillus cellulovorans TaxID=1906605 RepID=A0A2A6DZE5_9BACL|nr:MAG: hypothetical protein BLM47_08870 [Candidatus Reconcilbacillus cellulovorans]